jgi:uncharacterized YigZ family protein
MNKIYEDKPTIKMQEMDHYFTIGDNAVAEFKDKGSKFLAYAFHLRDTNDFKNKLQEIKKEHPKATHFCFAYRIGVDRNQFRVSDAGEPSGTAGRQILGQIDSKNLTNVLVVVVRYFGGTLLGVPGLIKAYKTVSSFVLQCTPVVRKDVQVYLQLHFNYTEMQEVMHIIKVFNCSILKNEMQLFCKMEIGIAINKTNEVVAALENIRNMEVHSLNKN